MSNLIGEVYKKYKDADIEVVGSSDGQGWIILKNTSYHFIDIKIPIDKSTTIEDVERLIAHEIMIELKESIDYKESELKYLRNAYDHHMKAHPYLVNK